MSLRVERACGAKLAIGGARVIEVDEPVPVIESVVEHPQAKAKADQEALKAQAAQEREQTIKNRNEYKARLKSNTK
jgi:hypothetical protein